jgi:hypothetical protein
MLSFSAQFVAAVLALGTNVARPSAALMSDAAFTNECFLFSPLRASRNLSDAHLLSKCVPKGFSVRSKEQAAASSAKSVSELVLGTGLNYCFDLLVLGGDELWSEAANMATLAQALPATSSCERGCPLSRPLCKNTNGTLGCVKPTCDDCQAAVRQ